MLHADEPIFTSDGGHGMIFKTFDGKLLVSIHVPNRGPDERPKIFEIKEHAGWIKTA